MILLTLPVYNEEAILEKNTKKIHDFMVKNTEDQDWKIIIINNASTDNTKKIAKDLSEKMDKIGVVNLDKKGRGHALRQVWTNFDADIYAYCDMDLATNINCLPDLFKAIKQGYNLAIGSRYLDNSKTRRSFQRFLISKGCIFCIKLFNNTKISDFQCGFKAIDKKTAKNILPQTTDNNWFFDTELVLIANNNNFSIKEIGVNWQESPSTSINFIRDTLSFLKNLIKFKFSKK